MPDDPILAPWGRIRRIPVLPPPRLPVPADRIMFTKVTIRNFKRFDEVEVDLGNPVVFVGPNNSGKTSAMQALTLWDVGVRRWKEKRSGKRAPEKRSGVAINRLDLVSVPLPSAVMLWRSLQVRKSVKEDGNSQVENVRMDVVVEGTAKDGDWACGLEFDYANEESFYCRPMRLPGKGNGARMPVPESAGETPVSYLSPMSGLASILVSLV